MVSAVFAVVLLLFSDLTAAGMQRKTIVRQYCISQWLDDGRVPAFECMAPGDLNDTRKG